MIPRPAIVCLGLSQLVCWGISFYLIGGFGEAIAADLGWSRSLVHGGFSAALTVMGLVSPLVGRAIDRRGGRRVMVAGSIVMGAGCAGLALSCDVATYYAAWLCLGLAMRMTLYDAAFATLARLGGPLARRPIAQITLLGGLASTVLWPIGHALAAALGWRGAVLAYAGFALLTVPLHLAIPEGRYQAAAGEPDVATATPIGARGDRLLAGGLYALIVTLANFLNSGMSAHMIAVLDGLGLAASAAVWVSSLRGIGQSAARLCEVLLGRGWHPLNLNLVATGLLPLCFAAGLFSGQWLAAAIGFSFLYGAGNGLLTITRGTMPLVLFDHRVYGAFVGRLLMPSFFVSAAAPLVYAAVIERFGNEGALVLSFALAGAMLAAAIALRARFGPSRRL